MARLTPSQEKRLLRKHLIGDFGGGSWQTIRALIDKGMVTHPPNRDDVRIDPCTNSYLLVLTPEGKAYCDAHHLEMPS